MPKPSLNMSQKENFNLKNFYRDNFITPKTFRENSLQSNKNQVAGHSGFFSVSGGSNQCLKPFNTKCVRGRREHLFYQMMQYFNRDNEPNLNENNSSRADQTKLYFRSFDLVTHTYPTEEVCNCTIDRNVFKTLSQFVADFYHVKHLVGDSDEEERFDERKDEFLSEVYSNNLTCPCYGRNLLEKNTCSRDYDKINFLCLQDLSAHCEIPCIIDIKIGQITYDPMAIKEKVLEQSSKYRRLKEFGFRILGMKLGEEIKDKSFGKTLDTGEQVFEALDSFFNPLIDSESKCIVIDCILERIRGLLEWFEKININHLKFFSSSLLIVYDSNIIRTPTSDQCKMDDWQRLLANGVRVAMIDFAHVFHVHDNSTLHGDINLDNTRDHNYMFGLKKLETFLGYLRQRHDHSQRNNLNTNESH